MIKHAKGRTLRQEQLRAAGTTVVLNKHIRGYNAYKSVWLILQSFLKHEPGNDCSELEHVLTYFTECPSNRKCKAAVIEIYQNEWLIVKDLISSKDNGPDA